VTRNERVQHETCACGPARKKRLPRQQEEKEYEEEKGQGGERCRAQGQEQQQQRGFAQRERAARATQAAAGPARASGRAWLSDRETDRTLSRPRGQIE
jgi:hypothetical protein